MTRRMRLLLFSPLAILGLAVFLFLGGGVIRYLWNTLMPPLFGLHAVTFWQALGLLALCRILFGRLGGHGLDWSGNRRRFESRWKTMTPEERDRFRKGVLGRYAPSDPEPKEG